MTATGHHFRQQCAKGRQHTVLSVDTNILEGHWLCNLSHSHLTHLTLTLKMEAARPSETMATTDRAT